MQRHCNAFRCPGPCQRLVSEQSCNKPAAPDEQSMLVWELHCKLAAYGLQRALSHPIRISLLHQMGGACWLCVQDWPRLSKDDDSISDWVGCSV